MTAPVEAATDRRPVVLAWWPPVVVLITLITVAVAMGIVAHGLISPLDLIAGCTSEPVADVNGSCTSTQGWELASTVGQAVLVLAAVVALGVAIRRPASRLRVLCAGVVSLPVSLGWAVLMVVAASGTAASGSY